MVASYTRRTLLTVICEASIEARVVADARRLEIFGSGAAALDVDAGLAEVALIDH